MVCKPTTRKHRARIVFICLAFGVFFATQTAARAAVTPTTDAVTAPSNVMLDPAMPGTFEVSDQPLVDDAGRPLPAHPKLAHRSGLGGAVLTRPATADLAVPAAGSDAPLVVGDDLFNALSAHLVGGRGGSAAVSGATVRYPNRLPDVDVVDRVNAASIDETLVVHSAHAISKVRYAVMWPYDSTRAVSADGTTITVTQTSDPDAGETITATSAVDAAGTAFPVRLALTHGGFSVAVDTRGTQVAYPIAIDPTFTTDRQGRDEWMGYVCGARSNDGRDYAANDQRNTVKCADNPNVPSQMFVASLGSSGDFSLLSDGATGVGLAMATGAKVSKGEHAHVKLVSPPGGYFVGSDFRGQILDTSGDIQCSVSYQARGNAVSAHPNGSALFWAGYPGGPGTPEAFATFPVEVPTKKPGYVDIPDYGDDPTQVHMRGYYVLADGVDYTNPAVRSNLPRWFELELKATKKIAAADSTDRCSSEGSWIFQVYDPDPPTITEPNIGAISGAWYQPSYIDHANSNPDDPTNPWESLARAARSYNLSDDGSGIGSFTSYVDNNKNRTFSVCNDNNGDHSGETPCNETASGRLAKNKRDNPDFYDPTVIPHRALSDGRHSFQWGATDYVGNSSRSKLKPAAPNKPTANQAGWYWIDSTAPECGDAAGGAKNHAFTALVDPDHARVKFKYSDPGYSDRPKSGSGMASLTLMVNGVATNWPGTTSPVMSVAQAQKKFGAAPIDITVGARPTARYEIDVTMADRTLPAANTAVCVMKGKAPPVTPVVHAIRGAGGIVGTWTPVAGGPKRYHWTCTFANGAPAQSGSVASRRNIAEYHSDLCTAPAGVAVTVTVSASNAVGMGESDAATLAVDAHPVIDVASSQIAGAPWPRYDSFNGAIYTPSEGSSVNRYVVVRVDDTDNDLGAASAPNPLTAQLVDAQGNQVRPYSHKRSADPAPGDYGRLVLNVADPNAGGAWGDDSARVIVQLSDDPSKRIVRLEDAVDIATWSGAPATELLALGDAQTCVAGSGVAKTTLWTLDCAHVTFSTNPSTGAATVVVPIVPADNGATPGDGSPNEFPTVDETYDVSAFVRDQRQTADNQYLTGRSSNATPNPPGDGEPDTTLDANLNTLVLDRTLPAGSIDTAVIADNATYTDDGTWQLHIGLHAAGNDVLPSAATDPAYRDASGLATFQLLVDRLDSTGSVVQTTDVTGACALAAPLLEDAADTCDSSYEANYVGSYRARLDLVDVAGNHREIIEPFTVTAPPPTSQTALTGVRGAGGVAFKWGRPSHIAGFDWTCTVGGAPIASGHLPYVVGKLVYHTDLCRTAPGAVVTVSIVDDAPGYTDTTPATSTAQTDRQPSVCFGVDALSFPERYTKPCPVTNETFDAEWIAMYDNLNGTPYILSTGTTTRDIYAQVVDADANLMSAGMPDEDLHNIVDNQLHQPVWPNQSSSDVQNPDTARLIATITDPHATATDPGASAQVIVQLSSDPSARFMMLHEGFPLPDEATTPLSAGPNTCLADAADQSVQGTDWSLNCDELATPTFTPVDASHFNVRIPLHPQVVPGVPGTFPLTVFTTPDADYKVSLFVRDQRQAADDRYLTSDTSESSGLIAQSDVPDEQPQNIALANQPEHSVTDLVLDRIPPTATGNVALLTSRTVPMLENTDTPTDPTPSLATNPTHANASGIGQVGWDYFNGDTDERRGSAEGSNYCSPAIDVRQPLLFQLGPLSIQCDTPGLIYDNGTIDWTETVRDVAGNITTKTGSLDIPLPATITPTIERGAQGVVGTWKSTLFTGSYEWYCVDDTTGVSTGSAANPFHVAKIAADAASTVYRTNLCLGAPSDKITVYVRGLAPVAPFPPHSHGTDGAWGSAQGRVDSTPLIVAHADQSDYYDSLDGATYSDGTTNAKLPVVVDDDEGDLTAASTPDTVNATNTTPPPDRHLFWDPSYLPGGGDYGRMILAVTPHTPNRSKTSNAHIVAQLGSADGNVLVHYVEGALPPDSDLANIPIDPNDAHSCELGDDKNIGGTHWALNCAHIDFIYNTNDGFSGEPRVEQVTLRLPLYPTDTGFLGQRFTTPDQTYDVSIWVRDHRQVADNSYLDTGGGPGEMSYESAVPYVSYHLRLDRIPPTAGSLTGLPASVAPGAALQFQVANVTDPAPSAILPTDPSSFDAAGLADTRAEIVNTANDAVVSLATRTSALRQDAPSPTYTYGYSASVPTQPGNYAVRISVIDQVKNHTEYEYPFTVTAPDITPPVVSITKAWSGAGGVFITFPWPTDAQSGIRSVSWTVTGSRPCTAGTAPINIQHGGEGPYDGYDSATDSYWAFCQVPPGVSVTMRLSAVDNAGNATTVTANAVTAAARPTMAANSLAAYHDVPGAAASKIDVQMQGDSDWSHTTLGSVASSIGAQWQHDPSDDAASANARIVLRITPEQPPASGAPNPSAYLIEQAPITQLDGVAQTQLARMWIVDGTTLGNAMAAPVPDNACYVGMGTVVSFSTTYWSLDCALSSASPSTGGEGYTGSFAVAPTAATPNGSYSLDGAGRSLRADDHRFLWTPNSSGADGGISTNDAGNTVATLTSGPVSDAPTAWVSEGTLIIGPTTAPPGTPIASFGTDGTVVTGEPNQLLASQDVVVAPNGDIIDIGAVRTSPSSNYYSLFMQRLHADGTPDTAFGSGGTLTQAIPQVATMTGASAVVQPDGKIVVFCDAKILPDRIFFMIVERFNADGTLDPTFGTNGMTYVYPVAGNPSAGTGLAISVGRSLIDSAGKLVVTAGVQDPAGGYQYGVYRFTANGALDPTFGTDGVTTISFPGDLQSAGKDIVEQPNGDLVVAGYIALGSHLFDTTAFGVIRLLPDGSLDTNFASNGYFQLDKPPGEDTFVAVKLDSEQRILVSGVAAGDTGAQRTGEVFRLTPNGALDSTFGNGGQVDEAAATGGVGNYVDVLVRKDDKLVVATPAHIGSVTVFELVGYNEDGTLDTSFGTLGGYTTQATDATDAPVALTYTLDGNIAMVGSARTADDATTYLVTSLFAGDPP